jgi:hypothetical protein
MTEPGPAMGMYPSGGRTKVSCATLGLLWTGIGRIGPSEGFTGFTLMRSGGFAAWSWGFDGAVCE